jgi:ActR/RegA family two-component response regulator
MLQSSTLQSSTCTVQIPAATTTAATLPPEKLEEMREWSAGALTLSGIVFCEDTQILCVLERALDRLNIQTELALDAEEANQQFASTKFDMAIVDFENTALAASIVNALRSSKMNRDCTVIAIASDAKKHQDAFKCGANFTIPPVHTADAAMRCMRSSYFLMLRNKRASVRFPLEDAVSVLRNGDSKSISATVRNLSETGLKLKCPTTLQEGEVFEVDFQLPNGHVNAKARAVWLGGDEEAGCQFTTMDPASLKTVQEWINTKLTGRLH